MPDRNTALIKEKLKLKLKTVLLITVIWILSGIFFYIIEALNLNKELNRINIHIDSSNILLLRMISVTAAGIITGIFEAFMSEKRYAKLHFGKLIIYSTFYYMSLYFLLFTASIVLYQMFVFHNDMTIIGLPLLIINYFFTPNAFLGMIVFGIIVLFSTFMLRVREKFGPGTITNFLVGKYFTPKEEVRIFLFLDLKSSTSIAEKLGPLNYHRFLNDFYREITYPILYKKGEIYQYVGDEVSISWSEKNGLNNNNCIECFFEIENVIRHSIHNYLMKYDVFPEFKAGLHIGKTVAGEIGIIKREIVYSGDTLNTTARIQELCNVYGEQLIVSGDLMNRLSSKNNYLINELGEQYLRGRTASISLYSIRKQAAISAA